jgi:23S rRNA (uracil1939-C5)-methyltransferase/tRNA (uracil-5-)-methyltransferase
LTVDAQRKWKSIQVASALKRIGGFDGIVVNPTVGSINTYGYRSKITPHRQVERSPREIDSTNSPALKVGFQKRKTNQIVDTAHCALATNNVNNAYQMYRSRLTATKPPKISKAPNGVGAQSAQLLFRESQNGTVETDPAKFIETSVGSLTFTFKAGDFFQNNLFVLPMLVDHVIRQVAHPECRHLVDVYCGSGLFALSAAAHFTSVYGVELNADAVNSAQRNAQRNNIINAHFTVGKAESTFQAIAHLPREHTAVVIDPPRNGCDKAFIDQLLVFKPQRIVYVSCDPATQARDAKMLAAGGYTIEDVTPFDLFPQTRHIENVITFVREF